MRLVDQASWLRVKGFTRAGCRRIVRLILGFIVVGLIHITCLSAAEKPNIVFFLVDDMGWQDTSVPFHSGETQLNRDYRTPNMERLAKTSTLFTNAYACAMCTPTRVSLMTGLNAARHKVTNWTLNKDTSPDGPKGDIIPAAWMVNGLQPVGSGVNRTVEAKCLPAYLRELGYKTIHAGKAHFGTKGTPGAEPKNLGFDVNIAGSYMGGPGSYHGERNFSAAWRGGGRVWDIPGLEKYHGQDINLTEAITREVVSELGKTVREDKKPFYLYMSQYAVHAPFEPDKRFLAEFEGKPGFNKHKAVYASMLKSMDKSLGDLMDTLEELGVAGNTIIVFMSDNGSPRENPRNLPLRGHKIAPYEGGNRVPMMVHLPGKTTTTRRTAAPVIVEDIFPTFLEWAGIPQMPKNDGVSFAPLVAATEGDHGTRPLFWHYPNTYDIPPFSSVRLGDLKLIYHHVDRSLELFNLRNDLEEANNLADKQPEDTRRLAKLLADHLREVGAQMPTLKSTGKAVPWPDGL